VEVGGIARSAEAQSREAQRGKQGGGMHGLQRRKAKERQSEATKGGGMQGLQMQKAKRHRVEGKRNGPHAQPHTMHSGSP